MKMFPGLHGLQTFFFFFFVVALSEENLFSFMRLRSNLLILSQEIAVLSVVVCLFANLKSIFSCSGMERVKFCKRFKVVLRFN